MALRITLRDGERIIVNGAVLRSSGRTELHVENKAAILRGSEVMSPADATTPARRLYLACMRAYIQEGGDVSVHQDEIVSRLGDLMQAMASDEARACCVRFARKVAEADYYRALADCRNLIDHEARLLAAPQDRAA